MATGSQVIKRAAAKLIGAAAPQRLTPVVTKLNRIVSGRAIAKEIHAPSTTSG